MNNPFLVDRKQPGSLKQTTLTNQLSVGEASKPPAQGFPPPYSMGSLAFEVAQPHITSILSDVLEYKILMNAILNEQAKVRPFEAAVFFA